MIPLKIFTGDLPTPIKYFNSEITHAYKDIEAAAELHLISLLPTELQDSFAPYLDSEQFSPEEKHLVKQADLICAYIKAQFELEHGNHEFKTAKKTFRKFDGTMAQPGNGLFFTSLFAKFWTPD